jgi:hypothetical protein
MPMPPGPFGLPPPTHFTSQLPPANFKHLVESSAISNGIQFFPQRDKKQDGKQVSGFLGILFHLIFPNSAGLHVRRFLRLPRWHIALCLQPDEAPMAAGKFKSNA